MKNKLKLPGILLATALLLVCASASAKAQAPTPQNLTQDAPAQAVQARNLQAELNLTPEQIQKWRDLNRELREQEQVSNDRVRLARRALAEAMESPNPSEELIKPRAKELADAQSAVTQLQALRQARVLQILTPEQRIKLKEIRDRNQALVRERNQALRRAAQQQGVNAVDQRQGLQGGAKNPGLTPAQRRALRRIPKP